MYVSRIRLENIRAFDSLELNAEIPSVGSPLRKKRSRMHTVVIGLNGTCKTTLLRCLAIGLSDEQDAAGIISEPIGQLVQQGKQGGKITIDLVSKSSRPRRVTITTALQEERGQNVLKQQRVRIQGKQPSSTSMRRLRKDIFVCAYGAGRSGASAPVDTYRDYRVIDSTYSLFSYEQSMLDVELTLRRLEDFLGQDQYRRTLAGIKRVVGLGDRDEIRVGKGGGVYVSGKHIGRKIPLHSWADGYRLTFAWLVDLYGWAMRANRVTKSGIFVVLR